MTNPTIRHFAPDAYREHPLKILQYSAKNLWLLIFPLLRTLRFYPFSLQNLIDWGAGAWFDLLVALLILGIGTLRWQACLFEFDEVSIRYQSGVLLQRGKEISLDRIAVSVEEHSIYLRPFRAVRLQISTAADAIPEADLTMILRLRDLHKMRQVIPVLQNDSAQSTAYRTPTWRVLLFSALFSSSFSGAIYLATLFFQGGRIVSDLLAQFQAQQLLEDAANRATSTFHGVPRMAVIIGIVVLALWLLSFLRNLLRYARFRIRLGSTFFSIHAGLLTRRHYHLRDTAIVFPDLRQNLIMKICGMVSLHIRCPGYGSRRDKLPVLIPLVRKKTSHQLLEKFHTFPITTPTQIYGKSPLRFFWSFVWPPVLALCALLPTRWLLLQLLPQFAEMIRFFTLMLFIPMLWLLCIRVVSLFTQYIAMDDAYVQMHFCRWFTFHTITVRREHIIRTDIVQTPFQKQYGVCHLYFVCNGPRQERYKLTAIPEETARIILSRLSQ